MSSQTVQVLQQKLAQAQQVAANAGAAVQAKLPAQITTSGRPVVLGLVGLVALYAVVKVCQMLYEKMANKKKGPLKFGPNKEKTRSRAGANSPSRSKESAGSGIQQERAVFGKQEDDEASGRVRKRSPKKRASQKRTSSLGSPTRSAGL